MTERLFESNGFWEEVYPNEDRRSRVKSFVDGVSSGLERLEKVLLIRFGNGAEKLYLFINPPIPDDSSGDAKELGTILHLSGPRTLEPVLGLKMTREEMYCITNTVNDNFSDSGWEIKDWPWPFEFTEESYQSTLKKSKSTREAQKFTLWERQQEVAQV